MAVIIGIDAAWTATEPSGVALVTSVDGRWRCVAVAPSYDSFLGLASGCAVDWGRPRFSGSAANVPQLLGAARSLARTAVDLVTIDMPVSTEPITARRNSDRAISRMFGGRGCSTHTPGATRPGSLGSALSASFADAGFPIATTATEAGTRHRLVEVYPHPALLTLLSRPYRVPYKVARSHRYLPRSSTNQRIESLLAEFQGILHGLEAIFEQIPPTLPAAAQVRSLRQLKQYEDALDALVCAWIGVCYMRGSARAFGDETSAIWCPVGAMEVTACGYGPAAASVP